MIVDEVFPTRAFMGVLKSIKRIAWKTNNEENVFDIT